MNQFNKKEEKIIAILLAHKELRSSEIHEQLIKQGENISLVTVKRTLAVLLKENILTIKGTGRATSYALNTLGRIFAPIDATAYVAIEPDNRYGLRHYNFDLFTEFPSEIFTDHELITFDQLTKSYQDKIVNLSVTVQKKELERLIIELAWKSSKIEGNTYTLLDTENLILKNKTADDKTPQESQMILNHKDAFSYVHENKHDFKTITKKNLEQVHRLLVREMSVGFDFRKNPVGISGSIYRPLDNIYQLSEAIIDLFELINNLATPYAKALLALLGISYIQPFEDGNKRTGRLMADAILLAHGCAPLSYRSIDEHDYRAATLVFYELNSIVSFKKIFMEQYEFAAENYAVK